MKLIFVLCRRFCLSSQNGFRGVRSLTMDMEVITSPVEHAEGPLWNEKSQSLYYVDTFQTTVLKWDYFSKNVTSHQLNGQSVGFLVPVKQMSNTFILCKDREVCMFKWDGATNNTGNVEDLFLVEKDKEFNQFNDGKVDAYGRLWAGTLTRNEDLSVAGGGGSLYAIQSLNEFTVENKISPVSISNGLAWSRDNNSFFYIDSVTRKVMRYNFDVIQGAIGQPKVLFDMNLYPTLKGIPDGMTIDTDDNLWIALFGGKSIIKVHSKTGKLLLVKKMPATYVTSVTFGGPAYSVLYVTTSKLKLSPNELLDEPTAGCVFAVYNLGVRGYPPEKFVLH